MQNQQCKYWAAEQKQLRALENEEHYEGEKPIPSVFLSPSTQAYNLYITGENERDQMNLLADAMEVFLDLAGIAYCRNDPEGNVRISVEMSNEGDYGLHLPLHSNAAPEGQSGQWRGPLVMFYPENSDEERAATYLAQQLATIYPDPASVVLRAESGLYELAQTIAPTAFVEVAFHDNLEDARWIVDNTIEIADRLTEGVANYFGVSYASNRPPHRAWVNVQTRLNVRKLPGTEFPIVTQLENQQCLCVLREIGCNGTSCQWSYICLEDGTRGWVASEFLRV
ncbi:MAG: N-acetylmuramoyl-L-alanine amidase [Oscillospiraceae bacterium]|nr:N-acetylmuramoyl-L-alanine amidase [Oscillospiraceae bacterium]